MVGLNGDAVGLGASIGSFGDVIVAAENAVITDRHLAMSLVPGDGGALSFPLSMGRALGQGVLPAQQADDSPGTKRSRCGTSVVPRDQLNAAVAEVVAQLLAQPRETLQWTKMVLKPPVPAVPATRQ